MRMIETGLFVYWKRRYWPPSADKCSVVGGNHPSGGPPIKGPRRFARRPSGRIRICVSHLPYTELAFGFTASSRYFNEQI